MNHPTCETKRFYCPVCDKYHDEPDPAAYIQREIVRRGRRDAVAFWVCQGLAIAFGVVMYIFVWRPLLFR